MNANYIDNDSFRNLVAAELIIFILLGAFGVVSLMLSVPFGIILYIEGTRGRPLTPEEGKRFSRSATFFIRFWR